MLTGIADAAASLALSAPPLRETPLGVHDCGRIGPGWDPPACHGPQWCSSGMAAAGGVPSEGCRHSFNRSHPLGPGPPGDNGRRSVYKAAIAASGLGPEKAWYVFCSSAEGQNPFTFWTLDVKSSIECARLSSAFAAGPISGPPTTAAKFSIDPVNSFMAAIGFLPTSAAALKPEEPFICSTSREISNSFAIVCARLSVTVVRIPDRAIAEEMRPASARSRAALSSMFG